MLEGKIIVWSFTWEWRKMWARMQTCRHLAIVINIITLVQKHMVDGGTVQRS